MKKKPTGFVAICQCGEVVGVMGYAPTDPKEAGEILGRWIAQGCTIKPQFSHTWSVTVVACTCAANP